MSLFHTTIFISSIDRKKKTDIIFMQLLFNNCIKSHTAKKEGDGSMRKDYQQSYS